MSEQLEAPFYSSRLEFPLACRYESSEREQACGEAVTRLYVGVDAFHVKGAYMYAFHLYELAHNGYPAEQQEWAFVGYVGTYIIVGIIVCLASRQFELSTPVVVPSSWDVVLPKVLVVKEVLVPAAAGIETASQLHVKCLKLVLLVGVFSVQLPSLVFRIRLHQPTGAALVVARQDWSVPRPWS